MVTIANNSITNNLDEKSVQLLDKCKTNNVLEKKIITTTETEIKKNKSFKQKILHDTKEFHIEY